jgi:OmpA-like transmembrane domain
VDLVKLSVATMVMASICWVTLASATESDNYVSVDAGVVSAPRTITYVGEPVVWAGTITSRNEIAWGFSVGHEFNQNFGMEGGYRDLGVLSGPVSPGGSFVLRNLHFTARGPTLSLVGMIPFGRWEAYGKLGVIGANFHLSIDGPEMAPLRNSVWDAAASAEIGVRYRIARVWETGLAESVFGPLGERNMTGTVHLWATTLSVRCRF